MKFPLILYMSPHGLKWQPKYLAYPKPVRRRPLTTPVISILEVSKSRHEDSLSMNRTTVSAFTRGIHMYTKTTAMSARAVLGAAIAACTLFTGSVAAQDDAVTVSIQVSTQGLDVSQPRGAQKLYWRLQHAARVACTRGNRVGLAPSPDPEGCREKALADAIRAAKITLLTQAYLASHTLREAAAHGIDVPVQVAAK
jgi:UrcA family protein